MKKASNGSGTQPRLRSDGRWHAKYTAGIDKGTGKPIRKNVYGATKTECAQKLREAVAKIDNGTYIEPSKQKLFQWCETWLNEFQTGIKAGVIQGRKSHCNRHIIPSLGAVTLERITPIDVQKFVNGLERKGLSAKTVHNICGTFSACLQDAVNARILPYNPFTGVKLPRVEKTEIEPLETVEIEQLEQAIIGNRYENVYSVLLNTGMRLGEVLGLRWSDIDFENSVIYVNGQLTVSRGKDCPSCIDTPKSGKPRSFMVVPAVLESLKDERKKQIESKLKAGLYWESNTTTAQGKAVRDLIFTTETGKHLYHTSIDANFKRLLKASGMRDIRIHDLRHTFATNAVNLGVDIETLSKKMLGHSNTGFTLTRYGHSTTEMERQSIAKLVAGMEQRKAR